MKLFYVLIILFFLMDVHLIINQEFGITTIFQTRKINYLKILVKFQFQETISTKQSI